jgi:alkylation response protein AidB-like acyl-CoA dehydrogenase
MTNVISTIRAKYRWTDWKMNTGELSPQLFVRQGYRNEYSTLPQYRGMPFGRLWGGTHEIMKAPTASSL